MPRNLTITTHWTAATGEGTYVCNTTRTCPGVHSLADRPDVLYVISRHVGDLGDGRVAGDVPTAMHPAGRVTTTRVTDPAELAAFADLMGPGEVLGTVPAHDWTGVLPAGVS